MPYENNSGLELRFGIAEQSTWGTGVGDSAAFKELEVDPFAINADVKVFDRPGYHGTRCAVHANKIIHTKGSMPEFTVAGPLKMSDIDYFLAAHFQNVTESSTAPYQKTFSYATGQPDFTSNAGYFYTVIQRDPQSSRSWKVTDCICKSLTITVEPDQPVMFSADMVGRGIPTFTSDPSGTWAIAENATSGEYFYFQDIVRSTIDWAGGDQTVVFKKLELTFEQEFEYQGYDGSGNFESFLVHSKKPTFSLNILKDAQGSSAISNWTGQTEIDVNIGWGSGTAGGSEHDLDIQFYGQIEDAPIDPEALLGIDIQGSMSGASAGQTPATIILANSLDRTW